MQGKLFQPKPTSFHLLEDEVESILLLKVLDQLEDVVVAATQVEDLNLFQHLSSTLVGSLSYDLNSELLVCQHIAIRLNAAR